MRNGLLLISLLKLYTFKERLMFISSVYESQLFMYV